MSSLSCRMLGSQHETATWHAAQCRCTLHPKRGGQQQHRKRASGCMFDEWCVVRTPASSGESSSWCQQIQRPPKKRHEARTGVLSRVFNRREILYIQMVRTAGKARVLGCLRLVGEWLRCVCVFVVCLLALAFGSKRKTHSVLVALYTNRSLIWFEPDLILQSIFS